MNKQHLRETLLKLTEQELRQTHANYEAFLASARLDRSEPVEIAKQAHAETAADLAEAFDDKLHDHSDKLSRLETIDFGPKDHVTEGAVIALGERYLVVGVSSAAFECEGKHFIGISTHAPIYQTLHGLSKGDVGCFNGKNVHICDVF